MQYFSRWFKVLSYCRRNFISDPLFMVERASYIPISWRYHSNLCLSKHLEVTFTENRNWKLEILMEKKNVISTKYLLKQNIKGYCRKWGMDGQIHLDRFSLYIDLKLYFENAELGGRPTSIQAFGTPDQPVIFVLGRSYLGHPGNPLYMY